MAHKGTTGTSMGGSTVRTRKRPFKVGGGPWPKNRVSNPAPSPVTTSFHTKDCRALYSEPCTCGSG